MQAATGVRPGRRFFPLPRHPGRIWTIWRHPYWRGRRARGAEPRDERRALNLVGERFLHQALILRSPPRTPRSPSFQRKEFSVFSVSRWPRKDG